MSPIGFLPTRGAAANGVLAVKFVAKPGSRAGAVYDVRLLDER